MYFCTILQLCQIRRAFQLHVCSSAHCQFLYMYVYDSAAPEGGLSILLLLLVFFGLVALEVDDARDLLVIGHDEAAPSLLNMMLHYVL
jgi:hypothetical protein